MSIIPRALLLLIATATILAAMMGSGILSGHQVSTAEQTWVLRDQQQMLLLRGQVTALQAQISLAAYLRGDSVAYVSARNHRVELERLAAEYRANAPADAATDRYVAAATSFGAALEAQVAAYQARGTRGAQAVAAATAELTAAQDALLGRVTAEAADARQALDAAHSFAASERTGAAILGLVLVLALGAGVFIYQIRPLYALARQARRAAGGAAPQQLHFELDGAAPGEARYLADALNALVAELREKYLELERVNAELHELNEEARSASEAKTAFVANISHELRTPLNAIIGFSEMLMDGMYGSVNTRQQSELERILRNSRQLLALINDVLDMSRVEAGKVSLNLAAVNAGELIENVAGLLAPLARQKKLALRVQVPPDLPPLTTDESRLRQVLINLLSNAVKFTRHGSVTLAAGIDRALPTWMIFRVVDTGIGIPTGELDRIWQEFYQVSSGLSRTAGGSGLGLAIVRKLVNLLGGDIEVKSQEGKGTMFTVYIPLSPTTAHDGTAGASLYAATGSYSARRRLGPDAPAAK